MSAGGFEKTQALPVQGLPLGVRLRALHELGKPSLSMMVVLSGVLGFFLSSVPFELGRLTWLVLGLYATSAGAAGMNMVLEERSDLEMRRTRGRPVPSGRVSANLALVFSLGLFFCGFLLLFFLVNPLTAGLAHLTGALYVMVYTPMKKLGAVAIWVGAVPGALPPVMGFTAAEGTIQLPAIALFLVLFFWQFPHFLALAWMYREDYLRGGFDFFGARPRAEQRVVRTMLLTTALLLLTSLSLAPLGQAGWFYSVMALIAGAWFLRVVLRLRRSPEAPVARRVFFASITYLPVLLLALVVDRLIS